MCVGGGEKWDEGYREAWREGRGRERASDVRPPLLGDCEWEQLEVREQGRTRGAKADTLHHTHRENIHMHIIPTSKPHRCMPSHGCTHRETHPHRRNDTHPHARALSYSHHIILLYPALSISPLHTLSLHSYLKSLLHSLYHPIISTSLSSSFTPSIFSSTPYYFPPSLAQASTLCLHYKRDG